jgi:lipid-binding SYLF domain-containing protein
MKTWLKIMIAFSLLLTTQTFAGWDANEERDVHESIAEFKKHDPDMQTFFDKAWGYAVYPGIGKAGIGFGGAHGGGLVFEQGILVGSTKLTQLTFGFQLGAQLYQEIIFFENKAALDDFKGGHYELGAQVSAVAVTLGASADAGYDHGVAVFTLAKGGLMYEASVGGQKFKYTPK